MTNPAQPFPGITHRRAPKRDALSDANDVSETVAGVLKAVQTRGDAAVREFAARFDKSELDVFEVSMADREAAVANLDPQTRADTEFAIGNVRAFAEAQRATMLPLDVEIIPGVHLGHRIIPLERVGCYVPGGRYPLLSAPIMTIVPAKVAGVQEVVACLPPNAHEAMVAGCHLSGADRIFRIGGAQAIAAMAFGTETVPKVDKIVGPGNAFVNEAKRQVFGPIGIDQLAGPSEIYTVADSSGDAEMLATDLLAQAEHDVRTRVGLITTDPALADAVIAEVERQLQEIETAETAGIAWEDYGEVAVAEDEAAMLAYSDFIAPEHLQVHTVDPQATAKKLRHYGSLFIGELASVVYSDKCCGTNHTLPTMAAGRYTGGLWVGAYVKVATHQWMEPHGVQAVAPPAVRQSRSEGLDGHRRAAQLRLDRLQAS
ncbi:histidinol dehydrogenase [Ponticoccus sp. SC2-23]|uniref:histidinol dehydrogenase n=1 Tax=Alexandriicola marinus TaxID=2081710 RepID=UPI000FDBC56B|nr:histidinol dehydrogenase [Alexandriicola marinus]MBM1219757.1 histidinol dehydrogenase [Ponticoccus sp. SC6-9]MBM1223171.1 histidinol dehydrogenase [Ponticoccus sp. SC6-15]MBM1229570.1 histidinol dehydrogenase [Ponticoccus sp. SC6-38]MBM1232137.1 histidinol dehydrogenase [Ponticoccus sp. SC6-45]MBM1237913.1 histidinol dehydrogenase [Ponticoccus sp. SC6-49]MBM1241148.1 histidinol dehydrogenase [Ponticoccus sp. SC2-64]MBM1245661.1 histidinol dehydrogenase [Ponticoccus sp. SC6-42]MBM1250139